MNARITVAIILFLLKGLAHAAEIQPADDAPQPLSPAESMAKMRLPEGFRIELVASEPLIQEPSCIAFDEFGRLFATELHGYNVEGELDVAELNKTGKLDTEVRRLRWEFMGGKIAEQAKVLQYGKLKMLSDTDGDGRMDKADLWADNLPPAYGVIPAYGGVVVVAAPDILFLADRDGDGKAEVRKTLYTGFHKREMERGINNPRRGPDNWIYVGAGGHGGTIERPESLLEDEADPLPPVQLGHSDFRINLRTREIEPVTGRVGTFGLGINDVGDRFPCSGGQPAIYALPLEYTLLTKNPWVRTPSMNFSAANYGNGFRISDPHPWRVRRRLDPAWIKFYGNRETDSNYFTGGCGGEIYNSDQFPDQYHGDFFYCEPSLNIVHRCELTRDGAGYRGQRAASEEKSEFLASRDQWFRPMNLRTGPDGALYIVDMYREIIEDYSAIPRFLQQQYGLDKGRDKGRIWRLIPQDVPRAKSLAVVERDGKLTHEAFVSLLESPNLWHRNAAQRMLLEATVALDFNAVEALRSVVSDSQRPLARMHALHLLDASGELRPGELDQALRDSDSRVRRHALKLCAKRGDGKQHQAAIVGLLADEDPSVRLAIPFALPESRVLRELAQKHGEDRWLDSAIVAAADSPGELLVEILESRDPGPGETKLLQPLATTIAGQRDTDGIVEALKYATLVPEHALKAVLEGLLRGLPRGDAKLKLEDPQMLGLIQIFRQNPSPAVIYLAGRVGARIGDPNQSLPQMIFDRAARLALSDDTQLEHRTKAIAVLSEAPFARLAPIVSSLHDARQPPELQRAALDAVRDSADAAVTELLLRKWSAFTPEMRKQVVEALFARTDRAQHVLAAIKSGTIPGKELSERQREQLLAHSDEKVRADALSLLDNAGAPLELNELMERYAAALDNARDLAAGEKVFEENCLNCHRLNERGHEVGPALGSIVNKPDVAILAEILDPNIKIDSEYAAYTVITQEGTTLTGVLASESPTSVTLKMEKGKTGSILRNRIDQIKASGVSLMPSGLHEKISPTEMANLLGFLRKAYQR